MQFQEELELLIEIEDRLNGVLSQVTPVLISIDGLGGAGKTTLSKSIVSRFEGVHFDIDEHINPYQGTYLPNLRFKDLMSAFTKALDSNPRLIIVEGFCVLSVFKRMNRTPNLSIYIKRIDRYGDWIDEFYYSEENDLDEVLRRLDRIEALHPDKPGQADNDRELVRYHIEGKPITRADLIWNHHNEKSFA